MDSQGLLLSAKVHSAAIVDRVGGPELLWQMGLQGKWPCLAVMYAAVIGKAKFKHIHLDCSLRQVTHEQARNHFQYAMSRQWALFLIRRARYNKKRPPDINIVNALIILKLISRSN